MASISSPSRLGRPPTAFKNVSPSPRRNSELFRPRLPRDPFANSAFHERPPVILNTERLFRAASAEHPLRHVVLVLGDPNPRDLAPLINSERLAFSLLILASHQPPSLPSKVQPTVRVLRLAEPLALEQLGAVRLVNVLEWAERVARTWRKLGGTGIEELAECDQEDVGALAPPPMNVLHRLRTFSNPQSLAASPESPTSHPDSDSSAPPSLAFDKFRSRAKRRRHSERGIPAADPSQRPFDALLNYLPSGMPDKSLLKYTILVTTISRPFLSAVTPPSARPPQANNPRSSTIFKRISIYSVTSTPLGSEDSFNSILTGSPFSNAPPIKAHLVHLLPPRPRNSVANRLLDSIETFLLSFVFPPTFEKGIAVSADVPRACLVESNAFVEPVATPPSLTTRWTVADILLSGCLDNEPIPRVWFSGASDLVVAAVPPSQPQQQSPSTPPPAHLLDHRTSTSSSPDSSRPSFNLMPTPPDSSEEALSQRRASLVKKKRNTLSWPWRLWKRPTTATMPR